MALGIQRIAAIRVFVDGSGGTIDPFVAAETTDAGIAVEEERAGAAGDGVPVKVYRDR